MHNSEYTKQNLCILVNFMIHKVYLNKAIKKNDEAKITLSF